MFHIRGWLFATSPSLDANDGFLVGWEGGIAPYITCSMTSSYNLRLILVYFIFPDLFLYIKPQTNAHLSIPNEICFRICTLVPETYPTYLGQ